MSSVTTWVTFYNVSAAAPAAMKEDAYQEGPAAMKEDAYQEELSLEFMALADVYLIIEGKTFHAHSHFLAAHSGLLLRMLKTSRLRPTPSSRGSSRALSSATTALLWRNLWAQYTNHPAFASPSMAPGKCWTLQTAWSASKCSRLGKTCWRVNMVGYQSSRPSSGSAYCDPPCLVCRSSHDTR